MPFIVSRIFNDPGAFTMGNAVPQAYQQRYMHDMAPDSRRNMPFIVRRIFKVPGAFTMGNAVPQAYQQRSMHDMAPNSRRNARRYFIIERQSLPYNVQFQQGSHNTAFPRGSDQNATDPSNMPVVERGFKLQLDTKNYKPEELTVRVDNDILIVEGNQEITIDGDVMSTKYFLYKYKLPWNMDKEKLTSSLSPEGILFISAPEILASFTRGINLYCDILRHLISAPL